MRMFFEILMVLGLLGWLFLGIWFVERKMQIGEAWIIAWMPLVIITGLLTFGWIIFFYEEITQEVTIVEIGGCNRHSCGVRYSDGSVGQEETPVIGTTIIKRKWERK